MAEQFSGNFKLTYKISLPETESDIFVLEKTIYFSLEWQ